MKNACHNKSFIAVLLFIIFIFSSCVTVKNKNTLKPVYITNTKKISLLQPENIAVISDELQLLTGSYGQTSFSLLLYSQINEKEINLTLLNEFGTDMGSLFFDGKEVIFESAFLSGKLPAEYIIADIQNAYYNADALKKSFASSNLIFCEEENIRRIYDGKNLIEEITFLNNTVSIKNFLRGYEYNLEKVEE